MLPIILSKPQKHIKLFMYEKAVIKEKNRK